MPCITQGRRPGDARRDASALQQPAQHEVQDPAVAVVLPLVGGVDAHARVELDRVPPSRRRGGTCLHLTRRRRSPLPIPELAGTPRRDDGINVAAAALRAAQPPGPDEQIEIGAMPLGLFAGIDVNPVPAILAPDVQ